MKLLLASIGLNNKVAKDAILGLTSSKTHAGRTIALCNNAYRFRLVRVVRALVVGSFLRKLGYEVIHLDLAQMSEAEFAISLHIFSNLYVGPGDTRRLAKVMQDTGFGQRLVDHLRNEDGLWIGESAGSIMAGFSIQTADSLGDSQAVQPSSLLGLNLLPNGASILPHAKAGIIAKYLNSPLSKTLEDEGSQVHCLADGDIMIVTDYMMKTKQREAKIQT